MTNQNQKHTKGVLVIGDLILDEYWHGSSDRISPEAPVPVVLKERVEFKLGGAANVAQNILSLEEQVFLIGTVGKDSASKNLKDLLDKKKINFSLIEEASKPTIQKLRILANQHYIGRVDTEEEFQTNFKEILKVFPSDLPDYCILSDYGKGTLADSNKIIEYLNKKNCKVFVDPKNSFDKYIGSYLIKPNKKEFTDYCGRFSSVVEIEKIAKDALTKWQIQNMLITLGSEGMIFVSENQFLHLNSKALDVFDVTGAGDTVIASLVSFLLKGFPIKEAIGYANEAAAISVSKKGVYNVSLKELQKI